MLAQLDRVFGYEPKGQGFESLAPRQNKALTLCVVALFCCGSMPTEPPRIAVRQLRKNTRKKAAKNPTQSACSGSDPLHRAKKVVSIGYDFFYPSRRLGISLTHEVRRISSAPLELYIITHQRAFLCDLMICNTACW